MGAVTDFFKEPGTDPIIVSIICFFLGLSFLFGMYKFYQSGWIVISPILILVSIVLIIAGFLGMVKSTLVKLHFIKED